MTDTTEHMTTAPALTAAEVTAAEVTAAEVTGPTDVPGRARPPTDSENAANRTQSVRA